jgi:hypothetical protein
MNQEQDSGGLTPHPLIRALATRLVGEGDPEIADALAVTRNESISEETRNATNTFACKRELPELTTFSGYLGGTVDSNGTQWRVMYQDAKALTWLLVPEKQIVLHDRVEDKSAAFGKRDVIWVKTDTPVRQGRGAQDSQARFLVGSFTSAGDLYASLTDASALSPESGILCAPTPECCMRHSR